MIFLRRCAVCSVEKRGNLVSPIQVLVTYVFTGLTSAQPLFWEISEVAEVATNFGIP